MPATFTTVAEALRKLKQVEPNTETYQLGRMQAAVEALGHPERHYRVVHIGGTSGKGSTSVMTASILEAAGYSVGLYTSPAFKTPLNGIVVNGKAITETQALRLLNKLWPIIEQHTLTQFEALALLTFKWFADQHVDFAVIEVGVGGKFDATNVVQPTVAMVTTIGLDHTALLGVTLKEIAEHKAGIFKPGAVNLTGSPLVRGGKYVDTAAAKVLQTDWSGTQFNYGKLKRLQLSVVGDYQLQNAVLAIQIAKALHIAEAPIRLGLSRAKLKGRLQLVSRKPLIVIDGAHNPQKMTAVTKSLRSLLPKRRPKLVVLCAVKETKDLRATLKPLMPLVDQLIVTTFPHSYSAQHVKRVAKALKSSLPIKVEPNAKKAYASFKQQLQPEQVGLVIGSLYLLDLLYDLR